MCFKGENFRFDWKNGNIYSMEIIMQEIVCGFCRNQSVEICPKLNDVILNISFTSSNSSRLRQSNRFYASRRKGTRSETTFSKTSIARRNRTAHEDNCLTWKSYIVVFT